MLGGNATVLLLFLLNAVFRGAGDAAIAMRVLVLGNALNIVLGPCFIFGLGPFPELGVAGAAVATNIGRGTAVLYQLVDARSRRRARPRRGCATCGSTSRRCGRVLRLSGLGTFQILIGTASYIGLVRILSIFGSAALAGYTIGIRIIIFALLPAFGLSNAAATMVGQNLGANRPDRAEQAVWTAARYNMVFLGSVGLVFLVGAHLHRRAVHDDPRCSPTPSLPAHRQPRLRLLRVRHGADLSRSTAPATRGRRRSSTCSCSGCSRSRWRGCSRRATDFRAHGVFIALTVSYSTLAVVSALLFRRGKWKTQRCRCRI